MAYTFQGMVSMQGDSYAASFDEVLNGRCVERPLAHTMVKRLLDEHGMCAVSYTHLTLPTILTV